MASEDAPPDSTGPTAVFGMTDLEEALKGPNGDAVRRDVIARLEALMTQLQDQLRQGVEPSRFEATHRIHAALAMANRFMVGRGL